jgi:hypothetical protein
MVNKSDMPGMFGITDRLLARHPLDEKRAFEWLAGERVKGTTWKDAKKAIRVQMEDDFGITDKDMIKKELVVAKKLFKPWLR